MDRLPVFVYGTLRAGEANAAVIDADVVRRAAATLLGHRLHELEHPCVVADAATPDRRVHGELVELDAGSYTAALARLDRFEGFDASDPGASLYVRARVTAETDAGPVACWVYVAGTALRARLDESNHVTSGDWTAT